VLLFATGCSAGTEEDAEPGRIVVKYGYQPGHAQTVIAREKGFYAEELGDDVRIDFVKFQSGPSLITALTANQLDFGQVGDQPAIQAKANNVDLKIIGKFLFSDKVNGLIVREDSDIASIEDLKGRKVGVTVGSTGQQLLYIYLESVGLKPSDINQINLQPGDIVSSITFRNIDAAVTWEPYITLTVAQGATRQLADGTDYKTEIDVIIGRNAFLERYPDIARGILKAQDKAGKWIAENPEEALALVAKDAGLDKSVLEPIFSKIEVDNVNLTDADIESIGDSIEFSVKYNLIPEAFTPWDFIDTRYLEQAGLRP
jgi:sulfonate transport system substrate-binding protein